jgi:hypothetical protein
VKDEDILEVLLELAAEAGMRVKVAGREARGAEAMPLASGVCRVRGELWVVLASSEPVSAQIRTLGAALRAHAAPLLEARHLPPAVRAALEGSPPIA